MDFINWWISELEVNLVMSLFCGTSQLLRSAYHLSCRHMLWYKYQWHTEFCSRLQIRGDFVGRAQHNSRKTSSERDTCFQLPCAGGAGNTALHSQQYVSFAGSAGPAGLMREEPGYTHTSRSPPTPCPYGWKSLVKIRSDPRSTSPRTYTPEQVCQLLISNCNYTFKAFLKTCSSHLAYLCLLR